MTVAALICATACVSAFGFHRRSLQSRQSTRFAWAAMTGLVAGAGVWATHFIAMLAYQPDLPMGYEPIGTGASLVIAIVGMGLGFAVPVLAPGREARIAGGALTGLAVGAMHFTGMTAVRAPVHLDWDPAYVFAALLLGALGAIAAFEARARLQGPVAWAVGPVLLVLAIVSLHFTAMTAVRLTPDPLLAPPAHMVGRGTLAAATAGLAGLIFAASVSLIWMERLGRRSTLSGLRDALDVVPAGLAFFDPDGRLASWNRAFAQLMGGAVRLEPGLTRADLIEAAIGAGWRQVSESERPGRWQAHAQGDELQASELHLPDGRWIRHEAFRTHDGGGVTVMSDITEARETTRVLAEARDAAEAANRAKTQFLANISHEIRTPLNGVLGIAEGLTHTRLSTKQKGLVSVIRSSGELLNALLGDLLDLARIEAGAAELKPQRTELALVAQTVADLYAPRAEEKGLSLVVDIREGAGAIVLCDAVRLRQVLGNLVDNAIKFTAGGEVRLQLTRLGDRVGFEVRDTGAGFDDAAKAVLLRRFSQADGASTRRHGGAGLGLAICDEYVRLMGGELDCESRPGLGSAFGFTLDLPEIEAAALGEDAPAGGRFRVLVVDDNAVNRQVLQLILESAGLESHAVADGAQAVEAFQCGGYDAILMDIQMPVMDGLEATRRIRRLESARGRSRTPLYIVSANGLEEHVAAGQAAGADGHFMKPVSAAGLLSALQPHVAAAVKAA